MMRSGCRSDGAADRGDAFGHVADRLEHLARPLGDCLTRRGGRRSARAAGAATARRAGARRAHPFGGRRLRHVMLPRCRRDAAQTHRVDEQLESDRGRRCAARRPRQCRLPEPSAPSYDIPGRGSRWTSGNRDGRTLATVHIVGRIPAGRPSAWAPAPGIASGRSAALWCSGSAARAGGRAGRCSSSTIDRLQCRRTSWSRCCSAWSPRTSASSGPSCSRVCAPPGRRVLRIGIALVGFRLSLGEVFDLGPRALAGGVRRGGRHLQRDPTGSAGGWVSAVRCRCWSRPATRSAAHRRSRRPSRSRRPPTRRSPYSIALVTLCGTLAIFVLPPLGDLFGMNSEAFGCVDRRVGARRRPGGGGSLDA